MSKRQYWILFCTIMVVIVGAFASSYFLFSPRSAQSQSLATQTQDTTGLNITITVVLFILLTFSVLNLYTIFNAQIDKEKAEVASELRQGNSMIEILRTQVHAIELSMAEMRENVSEIELDARYESNFQRLMMQTLPVAVRSAAAGFFIAHTPRDNDLQIIQDVLTELQNGGAGDSPIAKQLVAILETWSLGKFGVSAGRTHL